MASVLAVKLTVAQTETLTRDLFRAFVQNRQAVNILFSGSRQGIFANCIEKGAAGAADRAGPDLCRRPQAGHPAFLLRAGVFLRLCQQQQPDGRKTPRRSSGRDRESGPENHRITQRSFRQPPEAPLFGEKITHPKRRSLPAHGRRGR